MILLQSQESETRNRVSRKVKRTILLAYFELRTAANTVKNKVHSQLWQNISVYGSCSVLLYRLSIAKRMKSGNLVLDKETALFDLKSE